MKTAAATLKTGTAAMIMVMFVSVFFATRTQAAVPFLKGCGKTVTEVFATIQRPGDSGGCMALTDENMNRVNLTVISPEQAEQRAGAMTETMKTQLNLSDEQYALVANANRDACSKMDLARVSTDWNYNKLNAAGKKIARTRNMALRHILTPAQYRMYLAAGKNKNADYTTMF